MGAKIKFATQIDDKVLKDLKKFVDATDQSISSIVERFGGKAGVRDRGLQKSVNTALAFKNRSAEKSTL